MGIQATGKSTFVRQRLFDSHVRINLDMLRTRNRERLLFEACVEAGQPFVIDNTNATRTERERYLAPAREAGFRVIGYYFQSEIDASLRRNANRPEEARIPDAGIRGTHARLELPSRAEGFDSLFYVRQKEGDFDIQEWNDEV